MKAFKFSKQNPLQLGRIWEDSVEQYVGWSDDRQIRISTLIDQCKDLPIIEIPIEHLGISRKVSKDTIFIRDFVQHCHHIMEADLKYPIILDYDGEILEGRETILAKRMVDGPITEAKG